MYGPGRVPPRKQLTSKRKQKTMTNILNITDIEHTRRMTALKKLAAIQEKVITRILKKRVEKPAGPKRPQLKIVK